MAKNTKTKKKAKPQKLSRKALTEALDAATLKINEQAQEILRLQKEAREASANLKFIWTPIRIMYGWPVEDINGFVAAIEDFSRAVVGRRMSSHGDRMFTDGMKPFPSMGGVRRVG